LGSTTLLNWKIKKRGLAQNVIKDSQLPNFILAEVKLARQYIAKNAVVHKQSPDNKNSKNYAWNIKAASANFVVTTDALPPWNSITPIRKQKISLYQEQGY
jgi:hypothetical protein